MSGLRPAPKAKKELRIGEIDFISLCAAGDNPDAEVVLAKYWNPDAGDGQVSVNDMTTNVTNTGGSVNLDEVLKAALANVTRLEEQNALLAKMLEDSLDDEYYDDEDDYYDDDEDDYYVAKSLAVDDDYDLDDYEDEFDDYDDEYDDFDEFEDEFDDYDDEDLDDETMVAKRLYEDPILKDLFAAQQAQIAELSARAMRADEIAKAERDARISDLFKQRAESLEPLAEDPDELGYDMHELFKALPVESYKRWEERFVKWAAAIDEGGLFGEYGDPGALDPVDTYEAVLAKAANTADGLTAEQAFVKSLYENPALYSQMNGSTRR